jgi:hypothetical protein
MEIFAPGDRVVAINTDLSRPTGNPRGWPLSAFSFPDGPPRRDVVYHVAGVIPLPIPSQGLFITGLQVLLNDRPIPWNSSRFRKVDSLKGHAPRKRRRKQPVALA